MAKAIFRTMMALALILAVRPAAAVDLPLTAPQLDAMLRLSFPVSYQSGPYHIVLKDPKVRFYGARKRVGINARVRVSGPRGGHFAGRGTVSGSLHFDRRKQSLQLVRPELSELHVQSVSPELKPMLDEARSRLEGQQLPLIVLLDVHQLEQLLPMATITNISVGRNALIVSF